MTIILILLPSQADSLFDAYSGQVIKGWDQGFAGMKVGEKAILRCRSEYAYGKTGSPPIIPADATLDFDVELLGFGPKKKERWERSPEEILSTATTLKDKGTSAFKEKMFEEALSLYEEAVELLSQKDDNDYMTPEAKAVWIACKLNSSQVNISKCSRASISGTLSSCFCCCETIAPWMF